MPTISRSNWQTLEPLLDQALDLEPEDRVEWLRELSAESPALAAELTAFLAEEAFADRRGFLADQSDVNLEGVELGAYRLERPLGQGGMGTVWLARRTDGRFEGVAALKMLNLALVSPTVQERFRREGSVLARLAHPGIARLLDAGVSSTAQPYLVLEYVDGRPIDDFVEEHRLSLPDRIRLFLQVLDAVGHAHTNLIVHRDIKPSNILVTPDGTVKLLDFGIAKLLDSDTGGDRTALTLEGGRVFTPLYAAPEQVRGDSLTTTTDVYSLGVLLYVLLSGRHPTAEKSRTPADTVQALLTADPSRLGLGDLDTILAKALRKPPAERYQTVAAFGDDLNRYLRQEPVSARPQSMAYRVRKFVRRNRTGVIAGGLTAAGLLVATIFSVIQRREAEFQRDLALRQGRIAAAQVDFQTALLAQVGDRPITMREALDSGRVVLEKRFANDPVALLPVLLQLSENYVEMVGGIDISVTLLARAESLATANHLTEQLPIIRCAQSNAQRLQGNYDEAWRLLMSADSLPGAGEPRARASCLGQRATLGIEVDSAAPAIGWSREAMRIKDSLGETRDLEYVTLQTALAGALEQAGDPREAVAVNAQSVALMDSTGNGSTLYRDMARHNMSLTLIYLGETRAAEEILHDVLLSAASSDPTGTPWQPLVHYAETALYQGDVDSARKYFSQIVQQAARDTNLYWEGRGLFGLARAQAGLNDLAGAIRSKNRLEAILRSYPHAQDTDDVLPDGATIDGLVALARGDTARAEGLLRATLTRNGYFEGKRQRRLAPVALQLAETDLNLGEPGKALDLARRLRENLAVDSLSMRQSAKVGEARLIEGRALLALGDTTQGRSAIVDAIRALRFGAGPTHPRTIQAEQLATSLDAVPERDLQ
ncbi:MAG: protein kinase [Gemmatimonadota bacterium]